MSAFRLVSRPGTNRSQIGFAEFCVVFGDRILSGGNGPFTMMGKSPRRK
jgi:hypothetical protein